jgi:hypothetical protein
MFYLASRTSVCSRMKRMAVRRVMAGGIIGCVGAVQAAMSQPKTPEGNLKRGNLMNAHKSFGLLLAGLVPLRVAMRFMSVSMCVCLYLRASIHEYSLSV